MRDLVEDCAESLEINQHGEDVRLNVEVLEAFEKEVEEGGEGNVRDVSGLTAGEDAADATLAIDYRTGISRDKCTGLGATRKNSDLL